ncbi:MAG: hypothetical protein ACMXX9_01605 [Candidatus Woesearchaeota archaeon]
METTIIRVNKETRDKIKSLGKMGETYDDVISRMYEETVENIMVKNLLDVSDSVSIEEILKKRNML